MIAASRVDACAARRVGWIRAMNCKSPTVWLTVVLLGLAGPLVNVQPALAQTPAATSADAAQAQALAAQNRWPEAAVAYDRIARGQTQDPPATRQHAELQVAVCLMHMGLTRSSLRILGAVASNPQHAQARQGASLLSDLTRTLPTAARSEALLGAQIEPVIASFQGPADQERAAHLNLLLGKREYLRGSYEASIRAFDRVAASSQSAARSRLWKAAAYVRTHRSVPAVKALRDAIDLIELGVPGVADEALMLDVALASIARIHYAASVRDDESGSLIVSSTQLSAAHKYFQRIRASSPEWLEVAYEMAWMYVLAGDFVRAGGFLRTLTSSAFPSGRAASATVLRGYLAFALCRYDEAKGFATQFDRRFGADAAELQGLISRTLKTGREDAFLQLLADARDTRSPMDPDARATVERAQADRMIASHLAWLQRLDGELAALAATGAFGATPPGSDARAALQSERARVVRETSRLIREYLEAEQGELALATQQNTDLKASIAAAEHNRLGDQRGAQVTVAESKIYGQVAPRPVLWPFQGRLPDDVRRMESGFFYQPQGSQCGR